MSKNLQEFVRAELEPMTNRHQAKQEKAEYEEQIRKAQEAAEKSNSAEE